MTKTPLRVPKFVADGTVGIRKVFAGDYYNGTIEAFDADEGWYSVKYDDGDVEDITERECAALVQEYNQQTVQPADRTTNRGNLKRRRQSTLVDTTSEEESDEDQSEPTRTAHRRNTNTKRAKRGKRLPKRRHRQQVIDDDDDSLPLDTAQRRSNRRGTARPPTKKELALQAELADLLDRTDDYDDDDEDNNKSDDDSEPSFSEDTSSSEESAELDLVPTSEEEEESEESDEPTLRGAIRKLTANKKKKNGKQPGTRNRRQRSQNEEPPKQGRHQLSSADSSSDEDRGTTKNTATPRGRRRRRIRKTKTINVDMLAEAERGHALHASSSSEDDSDTANNNDPHPDPREHLPLGNDGIIIPSLLARHLQKHQVEGVKFMHESVCVQGKGCVLAHCMGLGKTLQAVTLIATLLATPVEWEGDEGNLSIERTSVGVREEGGAGRSRSAVTALDMPVGELRQELRNRGVNVTKIKKKELAELLELQWKQEAIPTKKKTAAGDVKEDRVCDSDSDSDCGIGDDDSEPKDVFGNKKRRPRTVLV